MQVAVAVEVWPQSAPAPSRADHTARVGAERFAMTDQKGGRLSQPPFIIYLPEPGWMLLGSSQRVWRIPDGAKTWNVNFGN